MACSSKDQLVFYLVFVSKLLKFRNIACCIKQSAVNNIIYVYYLNPTYQTSSVQLLNTMMFVKITKYVNYCLVVSHDGELRKMFVIAFTACLISYSGLLCSVIGQV
jgi:hypothetical protein